MTTSSVFSTTIVTVIGANVGGTGASENPPLPEILCWCHYLLIGTAKRAE